MRNPVGWKAARAFFALAGQGAARTRGALCVRRPCVFSPRDASPPLFTLLRPPGKTISVQLGSVGHDRAKQIPRTKVVSTAARTRSSTSSRKTRTSSSRSSTDFMLVQRPSSASKPDRLEPINQSETNTIIPKNNPSLSTRSVKHWRNRNRTTPTPPLKKAVRPERSRERHEVSARSPDNV